MNVELSQSKTTNHGVWRTWKFAPALVVALALSACGGTTSSTPTKSAPALAASADSRTASTAQRASAASGATGLVKIGYPQPSAIYGLSLLAQDQGLWKKYGLTTEVTTVPPTTGPKAVISGDVQFIHGGAALSPIAEGAPLTYLTETSQLYTFSLFGQQSIAKVSDLVGKSVGLGGAGTPTEFALRTLLAREGVDASKVNKVYLQTDANSLAALTSGTVQAAILAAPNTLLAQQAGLRLVVDMLPLKLHTLATGVYVNKDWARQHQDVVGSFLRGYLEAIKEYKTNPQVAQTSVRKVTKLEDPAMIDAAYKPAAAALAAYPLVSDTDVQEVMNASAEANVKSHQPPDFYDNSYLQKLEPFVKSLWPDGIPAI